MAVFFIQSNCASLNKIKVVVTLTLYCGMMSGIGQVMSKFCMSLTGTTCRLTCSQNQIFCQIFIFAKMQNFYFCNILFFQNKILRADFTQLPAIKILNRKTGVTSLVSIYYRCYLLHLSEHGTYINIL